MNCGMTLELKVPGASLSPGLPVVREYVLRATYIHVQDIPAAEWTIVHNMNTYPSVTIVDSAGTRVIGAVQYVDANTIVLSFSGAFSGKAFLN